MALEELLAENTKAILALNATLSKGAGGAVPNGSAGAATPSTAARGPGRPKKVSLADVKAIAEKVRDEKGRQAAVALINQHGAETLSELDEAKYPQFIAACQVVLSEQEPAGGEDEAAL